MANTFKKLTAILIIATTITGCGSGQTAVTRTIKQITDGVEAESNGIKLRNLLIVKTANSEGVLVATIVNTGEEADGIASLSIGGVVSTLSASNLNLVKNKPIIFAGESANADAFIGELSKSAGDRVDVTVNFVRAAPVTVSALVVNSEGVYKDLVRSVPAISAPATPAP
jgi:hypothetical protein